MTAGLALTGMPKPARLLLASPITVTPAAMSEVAGAESPRELNGCSASSFRFLCLGFGFFSCFA